MIEKVGPSVVSVRTQRIRRVDWLSRLRQGIFKRNSVEWQIDLGTGVALDSTGHILTTQDVVYGAEQIEIISSSGRIRKAYLVGSDKESDIAVLRVEETRFQSVELGDSDNLRPGQWAIIMGNSLGVQGTSLGIVNGQNERTGLIYLTARACPGNSGAPVFDSRGRVIGIVVAAISNGDIESENRYSTTSVHPLSLAVPINTASKAALELIGKKRPEGWLGITGSSSLDKVQGLLVTSVEEGSPAYAAGIKSKDIMLAYNGREIDDIWELMRRVKRTTPGKAAKLKVLRGKQEMWIDIKIGSRAKTVVSRG